MHSNLEVRLLIVLLASSLMSSGCASVASKTSFDKLIAIPKPPWSALLTTSGYFSTAVSNLNALERKRYQENEISFRMQDGTEVGGLLFRRPGRAPLLLATFGFLADRWSKAAAQFVRDHVEADPIASHVLIVDHPSSAAFLATNGELSIGGRDEGQMLLDVARQLRSGQAEALGLAVRSYHLLGVSLGGLGVLNAIDEDRRSSDRVFASAVTFSGVTRLDDASPEALVRNGSFIARAGGRDGFSLAAFVNHRIFKDLVRHFRTIYSELAGKDLAWSDADTARRLHELFDKRAMRLGEPGGLRAYMAATNLCSLGGESEIPIALIHAKDDPLVPVSHVRCVEDKATNNPNVAVYVTNNGGHWGFARTYGRDWVATVINRALTNARP